MDLIKEVSNFLSLDIDIITGIAEKAPNLYRTYHKKKKNGNGIRVIHHPAKSTKMLQYALMYGLLQDLEISTNAIAYVPKKKLDSFNSGIKGSPIKINATLHKSYSYSLHLDFKDFFPSIIPEDLITIIVKKRDLSSQEKDFIKNSLFIKKQGKYQLSIGAPSSPMISNIVMLELDKKIEQIAKSIDTSSRYTRYADDIVFSTNEKGKCSEFYKKISLLLNETKSPKLKLNKKKTNFSSKKTRKIVTGLYITPQNKISIGRKNKRYIKKLIWDYKNNNISKIEFNYLKGYLSYILDVEPTFYGSLIHKYTAPIINGILKDEIP